MLPRGKWRAIRNISLLLAAFFTVSAGLQYWFVKIQLLNVIVSNLHEGTESVRRAVNLQQGFDTKRYNRADVTAANYLVVAKTGSLIDIESFSIGPVPGILPPVEPPFQLESVLNRPATVKSEFSEEWRVLGRRLDKGFVLVGISEHDPVHDGDAQLLTNLNRLGTTLSGAVKNSRELDKTIDYAVIDDAGNLTAAAGRLPLRTNPLLLGKLPDGRLERTIGEARYVLLREALKDRTGQEAATVIAWADITGEQHVLNNQVRFGIGLALVSWALFLTFATWYWSKAEGEKRQVREAFQKYFSPRVMEAILADPGRLGLGGQRREVTILFSDIRSFTKLTEQLPPQQLTRLLQDYFTAMTEEVMATDGVVDKYIGDAIMAFWGAPIEQPDQADRAVQTAMNMIARLQKLKETWGADGFPLIDIGIGINLGVATVGNFGSTTRYDYTLLGDAVNAAARLEGLNKKFRSTVIISDSTKKQLTLNIKTEDLGAVTVDGREEPIRVHRVEI
jgi:class 3 adenylate cyclase